MRVLIVQTAELRIADDPTATQRSRFQAMETTEMGEPTEAVAPMDATATDDFVTAAAPHGPDP